LGGRHHRHGPAGRIGAISVPAVDPKNPDTVYVASTVMEICRRQQDLTVRGAQAHDYSTLINPNNPEIILIVSDQGAIISVNGGATWSSWYKQSRRRCTTSMPTMIFLIAAGGRKAARRAFRATAQLRPAHLPNDARRE
jgi:hypothetical protein